MKWYWILAIVLVSFSVGYIPTCIMLRREKSSENNNPESYSDGMPSVWVS